MKTTLVKMKRMNTETSWMFKVSSWRELEKYLETVGKRNEDEIILDLINHSERLAEKIRPYNSDIANKTLETVFRSCIDSPFKMYHSSIDAKMKIISKTGSIYFSENGSWSHLGENDEIIEEVMTIDYSYPEYTQDMIKIFKWPHGVHYFAKIGVIDVMDEEDRIKWNTKEMAMEKALQMMSELNIEEW